MQNVVFLGVENSTFEKFLDIFERLNNNDSEHLAHELGNVLADMSCHVVDLVFGEIAKIREHADLESENTLKQIKDNLKKYMPWAITFLSNERLKPLVQYLYNQMYSSNDQHFLSYRISEDLLNRAILTMQYIRSGQQAYVAQAFSIFTEIVDEGIERLIFTPKKLLKFNFVVDKTLTGVIHLTTQLGYKRIEKIAMQFELINAEKALTHFFSFLGYPDQSAL